MGPSPADRPGSLTHYAGSPFACSVVGPPWSTQPAYARVSPRCGELENALPTDRGAEWAGQQLGLPAGLLGGKERNGSSGWVGRPSACRPQWKVRSGRSYPRRISPQEWVPSASPHKRGLRMGSGGEAALIGPWPTPDGQGCTDRGGATPPGAPAGNKGARP